MPRTGLALPRLTFHGAARGVTGSCYRLDHAGQTVLLDCGLFQGSKSEKELNYRAFPFDAPRIDAVILTHAHIDHSGLLPKLVRDGWSGPIHATDATADLAAVMLPDSAHIQEVEVDHLNRRNARHNARSHAHSNAHSNRGGVEPIYTTSDAAACIALFQRHGYGDWFAVTPAIRARFWNAGHLLGSASVELELARDAAAPLRLLFSGDLGPDYKLLQSRPDGPSGVDYLICESTYGDTDRGDVAPDRRRALLRDEVKAAMHPNGVLLIPSFAVERTQELISDLGELIAQGALPRIPIYIDSPLATQATRVFARHAHDLPGGKALLAGLKSRDLHFTETVEQSMALDRLHGFHIVIAASGMCDAGRIRHRLKNWLWRDEATVLLVGFQAAGTLGRILQDGASSVRIQGEEYAVRARIRSFDLYSGHADGPELLAWIKARLPLSATLFLTHGEETAIAALQSRLSGTVPPDRIVVPSLDESYDLGPARALPVESAIAPRITPEKIARMDWHNDVSRLLLDINQALREIPDERGRAVLIRRLRAAMPEMPETPTEPHRHKRH